MSITEQMFEQLLGFKLFIWNHYHGEKDGGGFSFWAQKLDEHKVPWFVQNTVAILMETRSNGFSSLKSLLKNEEIEVLLS